MKKTASKIPEKGTKTTKQWTTDLLFTLAGTLLFALSVHVFTAPNHIAPGGVSGISTIINYLTRNLLKGGLPIGFVNLIINIPIIIVGFRKLGRHFMIKTIISLLAFTFFADYGLSWLSPYTGNKLLAAIFGGVLTGGGIGLILSRGGSSGGMDIINKLIQRRVPHMKMGQIIFATDLVIIAFSIFAYGELEPGLYAIIAIYIQSVALDKVLYGFNICKFMYIVTDKTEEMGHRINLELHRGATIFESYGSYTNQKRPTIMVAVRQNEYYRIKKIISSTDPAAFVIVTSATEIMGKGFSAAQFDGAH